MANLQTFADAAKASEEVDPYFFEEGFLDQFVINLETFAKTIQESAPKN